MSSLLVGCGLPGGMTGALMSDRNGFGEVIKSPLRSLGKADVSLDQLTIMLFNEVEYVWPRLGYPPLVTPFSQYVKNTALMNLMATLKGQPRWAMIDKDTWNMILGRTGKLPGELAPEIVALAKEKGYEFYTGNPQDAFPDELDSFRSMIDEEDWDFRQEDEELFEFAIHERQYRDYRSGVAKERFEKELEDKRANKGTYVKAIHIQAPVKGQLIWHYDASGASSEPVAGTEVVAGQPVGYVQTYYGMEEIIPAVSGRIVEVKAMQGETVEKGQTLAYLQ